MTVRSYRDLKVWQTAMSLTNDVYTVTAAFPKAELYGLTSQIRRAAVSVPSNIAEGHARGTTRDFLRFLAMAQGSLAELETQFFIATRQGFLPEDNAAPLLSTADEVGKMLRSLQTSLNEKISPDR
jgi:four helix bundle protein